MTVDRRCVLKGMALGSLAVPSMSSPLLALAGETGAPVQSMTRPTQVLIDSGAAGAAFAQGARAVDDSSLPVHQAGRELGYLLDFERRLRRGQPLHVIGLLDDATAVLILDLARSAGAHMHWLGQHIADAGLSHHRLLNTNMTEGRVRQLSRQLHACGAGFTLTEERAAPARKLTNLRHSGDRSDQWAISIGYLLASLGTYHLARIPAASASSMPLSGSFVSFSIEARGSLINV